MKIVEYNSADVALLTDEPDWNSAVRLGVSLPTTSNRGLTGRESRKALGESLRLTLDWNSHVENEALNELRDSLQALEDKQVLSPAWPFMRAGSDWVNSAVTSSVLVGWDEGWTDYEISDALTPGDWDYVAPCLFGKLTEAINPSLVTQQDALIPFSFIEDSDAGLALVPDVVAWDNGPALADATTPKLFPFEPDWSENKSGGASVEVERVKLGPARTRAAIYYPQNAERPQEAALTLDSESDIAALLRWLFDRRFSVEAHYVKTLPMAARLAVTAAAGNNSLTLDDAAAIGTNRFLALTNGDAYEVVRVTAIAGNVCTLYANLADTWTAAQTMVNLAMLARHAADTARFEFYSPSCASVRLAWRELPAEYTVASGETRGTTLGALGTKARLYKVTLDWNGATEIHRFTNYEQDLTAAAEVWTAGTGIENSELRQTLNLDRDEITIKMRWDADGPFRKFLPNKLDCKVLLDIYDCDVTDDTGDNVTQWFSGEITGLPAADGPLLSLTAAGASALLDRRLLKLLMQPGCNDELFGPWCQLDRADWSFPAEVYSIVGKVVTLENFTYPAGAPAGFGFVHWFALGYLERSIDGEKVRHFIMDSAVIDGSSRIAVTLATAPDPAMTVGEELVAVPGCDGRPETCKAYDGVDNPEGKFDNYPNFSGFPFLPDLDPALQPLKKTDSPTGKK